MSEFQTLVSIGQLFAEVTENVEGLKKLDSTSRSLARRVSNEATMYDQLFCKLILVSHSSSHDEYIWKKIEARLGDKTARLLASNFQSMQKTLNKLKNDITNISLGIAVMNKLGPSIVDARKGPSRTTIQSRLDKLSTINKNFASYMANPWIPLPHLVRHHNPPNFRMFFHRERNLSTETLYVMSEGYNCSCKGFHVASYDCHCSACNVRFSESESWKDGWTCDFLFAPRSSASQLLISNSPTKPRVVDVPVQGYRSRQLGAEQIKTKLSPIRTPDTSMAASNPSAEGAEGDMHVGLPTQDRISVSEMVDRHEPKTHRRPGGSETENESFLRLLDDIKSEMPLVAHQDLIRPGRRELTQERRLELAFRFCAFFLRLSTTPWANNFQGWVNWDVSFGHLDGKAHCGQLPGRDFYSLQVSVEKSTDSVASRKTQPQQPTLTKLGISLIELAFGQSLGEIRQKTPGLLVEKDMQENFQAVDKHLLDILTAKQLLSSRRIRDEVGVGFEDVVGACIYRQYQEFRSLAIKELDMTQESFLDDAKFAILAPLYREILKYSQHECDGQHFDTLEFGDPTGNPETRTVHDVWNAHAHEDSTESVDTSNQTERQDDSVANEAWSYPLLVTACDNETDNIDYAHPILSSCGRSSEPPPTHSEDSEIRMSSETPSVPMQNSKEPAGRAPEEPIVMEESSRRTMHFAPGEEHNETPISQSSVDMDSEWSYNASTDLDSFSLASDVSNPPAPLPSNHPLLLIKEEAIELILRKYEQHLRKCAGESSAGGDSISIVSIPSAGGVNGGNELTIQAVGNTQPSRRLSVGTRRRPQENGNEETFACPFYKKDHVKHRSCTRYIISRIRDVKQHLRRYHEMPIYCSICYQIFRAEDQRDSHIRERSCFRSTNSPPDGINAGQRRRLARRVPTGQTQEQQWYGVFEILFPEHPKPSSPYINSELLRNALTYQDFIMDYGIRDLTDLVMQRYGGVLPDGFDSLLESATREGMEIVFSRYTSMGSTRGSGDTVANQTLSVPQQSAASSFDSFIDDELSVASGSSISGSQYHNAHYSISNDPWPGTNHGIFDTQLGGQSNGYATLQPPARMDTILGEIVFPRNTTQNNRGLYGDGQLDDGMQLQ